MPAFLHETPEDAYHRHRFGCRVVCLLSFLILLSIGLPWLPAFPQATPMSSALLVVHYAWIHSLHLGTELVTHYGPLGFLATNFYTPETYLWLMLGRGFFAVMFLVSVYHAITRLSLVPNPFVIFLLCVLAALSPDLLFLLLPWLVFLILTTSPRPSYPLTLFLLLGVALAGMVDVRIAMLALIVCIAADILRLPKRCVPGVTVIWCGLFLLFWVLCNQSVSALPEWFYSGITLRPDHSIWQQVTTPLLYGFIALLLIHCLSFIVLTIRQHGLYAVISILAFFFTLALMTRSYFALGDPTFANALGILFALYLTLYSTLHIFYPYIFRRFVLFFWLIMLGVLSFQLLGQILQRMAISPNWLADSVEALEGFPVSHQKHFAAAYEFIRKAHPLPNVGSTADILPNQPAILLAQNIPYSPRPVFQSRFVQTPYLARKNRDFLINTTPAHLFLNVGNYYNHFATAADALLWPEILRRYNITGVSGNYLHFIQRDTERPVSLIPIEETSTAMGRTVRVPPLSDDGGVWVTFHLKLTLLGRVFSLLYPPFPLKIEYRTTSGYTNTQLVSPGIAKSGFLLSPVLSNSLQLVLFARGEHEQLAPLGIQEMTFSPAVGWQWLAPYLYENNVTVTYHRLRFLPQKTDAINGWDTFTQQLATLTSYPFHSTIASPDFPADQHLRIDRSFGQQTLHVHGESRLFISLVGMENSLSATYGITRPSQESLPQGDGIYFIVDGVAKEGDVRQTLWKRLVPPLGPGQDTSQFPLHLPLPDGLKGVFLSTVPVSPEKSNRAYWSELEMEYGSE
ncbi:MAG: hypothetical protein H6908_01005 [Hyphomicrobiales bacterium]|nr:hypothetical protein [Hyphomicrobiales bacterium]